MGPVDLLRHRHYGVGVLQVGVALMDGAQDNGVVEAPDNGVEAARPCRHRPRRHQIDNNSPPGALTISNRKPQLETKS